jgi:hypothetical protein
MPLHSYFILIFFTLIFPIFYSKENKGFLFFMKIECVIVCKDYSDFLAHTLPDNLQHLDRLVVVTHPDDKATQTLCNKFGVDCLKTEVFHDDGDKFNKGRAINLGLSHLRHDGWLLHIDADIALSHRFRDMLSRAKLNDQFIYGADRLNVPSYESWIANKPTTVPQHQWRFMVTPHEKFSLGSRLLHSEYGYCPIGYFQLWHSSLRRTYPVVNGSAEHGDVLFAVQWPRERRILLPELFVYHLESEQGQMGMNWNGRKTKPFGPGDGRRPPHPPHPYCGSGE